MQTIKFEDADVNTCINLFSQWFNAQIKATLSKIQGVTFGGSETTPTFSFAINSYTCAFRTELSNVSDGQGSRTEYSFYQTGSANGSGQYTRVYVLRSDKVLNGKYVLEVNYLKSDNVFVVDKIIANGIIQADVPFSCVVCPNNTMDVIYCGHNGNGMLMNTLNHGRPTDSWTDVPINGLMNSVKIWSAQFGIYTNERIFRFKTGARFFPNIGGKYVKISGLGDFIILSAGKSGDVVSGLIYKV